MLVEFSFYVSFYPLQRDFLILIVCFCSIDLSEKKRKKRKVCKSRANIERHTFLCVIIGRYSLPLIVNFTALFLTVLALCVSALNILSYYTSEGVMEAFHKVFTKVKVWIKDWKKLPLQVKVLYLSVLM